ncbi:WD40-repeat-containing domain protein [Gorgonomyces haynaldii]|nr:WD40-repeat-containing domain protein [Gorgonomyces haynaldii]
MVYLYDTKGILIDHIKVNEPIQTFSFGWKSNKLIYIGTSKMLLYDLKDRKVVKEIQTDGAPTAIAVSTDDQKLAIGSQTGHVMVYSLKTNTPTKLQSHFEGKVTCLAFYPFKKSVLAAAGQDGSIRLWDVNQKLEPTHIKENAHTAPITGLSFAPCNKHFFCTVGLDNFLHFHDVTGGKQLLQSFESDAPLLSLAINDDHLVAAGSTGGKILFYDVKSRTVVQKLDIGDESVNKLAFYPPRWCVSAMEKQDKIPVRPKQVEVEKVAKQSNPMDMFSPINSNKTGTLLKSAVHRNIKSKLSLEKMMPQKESPTTPSPFNSTETLVDDFDSPNPFLKTPRKQSPPGTPVSHAVTPTILQAVSQNTSPKTPMTKSASQPDLSKSRSFEADSLNAINTQLMQSVNTQLLQSMNLLEAPLEMEALRTMVEQIVSEQTAVLKQDMHQLQVEMIRQFYLQKV